MAERMNQTVAPAYFEASRTDSPLGVRALAVCIPAIRISHNPLDCGSTLAYGVDTVLVDYRVHIMTKNSGAPMSTSMNLRKILREAVDKQAAVGGVISAALGDFRKEALLQLIVAYYNESDVAASAVVAGRFGTDYLFFNGVERLAWLLLTVTEGFRLDPETREPTDKQSTIVRKATRELLEGRRKFQGAVSWLCSNKDPKPASSPRKLSKLLKEGKLEWGRYPNIDRTTEDFIRYFEIHGLKHLRIHASLQGGRLVLVPRCIHFVDLFCGFLLIECSGKKLSEMPIKVCLHCRQLFAPPKRAEFCTRTCQWKHYWTPERRRDDIYVRRLEQRAKECLGRRYGFSMKDLQSMLVSRKVSERLKRVETDWKDWPRMIDRISTLRASVGQK